MIKVGIVLVPNVYLYSVGGMMDAFEIANDHISRQQGAQTRLFECRTVGVSDAAVVASGGITLRSDMTIAEAGGFDLIYVPAFCYKGMNAFENMISEQAPLLCWLSERRQQGSMLSANCTGTLLLAETGLLNRRRATTAWWLERPFRRRFPRVDLDANALLAEDDRLLTTGAMTAHLNMAIHLIGRHAGPHLAAICARTMLIDIGPNSQRPYQELLEHDLGVDPLVAKAQYWLQNNVGAAIDQKTLARRMNVSQRTLIRHFNAELGIAPLTYLQHVRIETAKKMLENTAAPLAEIVGRVGYFDLSSFTRLFKRKTGLTPHAYRQRFGQLGSSRSESVGRMPR